MSHLSFLLLLLSVLGTPIDETSTASILWARNGGGGIYMADLQTGYRRLIADTEYFLNGVTADVPSQTVYWSQNNTGLILRANWDGSSVQQIYQTDVPNGLATEGSNLYWCESVWNGSTSLGRIRKSNLDGTSVQDVIQSNELAPWQLAIDPAAQELFWADFGGGDRGYSIMRAGLDGTDIHTVIDLDHVPRSLALSPDRTKLYFVLEGAGVFRSNLDGSDIEFLLNISGGNDIEPLSLALLADGSGMYVGTVNSIWRANLDGSNAHLFLDNTGFVQAMSIVPEPASVACCALTLSLFCSRRRHFLPAT